MNTITAFSDSHNMPLPSRLIDVANESKYVFFLGDGLSSLGALLCHKGFYGVKGNCDAYPFDDEQIVEIDGVTILLTHGDKYHVKRGLLELDLRARELGCTLVFYGHTHFASIDENAGITFVCPGSTYSPLSGAPSYAYAVVHDGKFTVKIVNLT